MKTDLLIYNFRISVTNLSP